MEVKHHAGGGYEIENIRLSRFRAGQEVGGVEGQAVLTGSEMVVGTVDGEILPYDLVTEGSAISIPSRPGILFRWRAFPWLIDGTERGAWQANSE